MRYAIVKVHDQTEYHPNGETNQRQYAQFKNQVNIHGDRNGRYEWQSRRQKRKRISKISQRDNSRISLKL